MCIYLNNAASCYPRPRSVEQAVTDAARKTPYHPGRTGMDAGTRDFISECRSQLAALFHAETPSDIILNSGATESLNTAIQGLVPEYAHVLTTAIEHNSTLRPLYRMAEENRIELSIVKCDHRGFVDLDQLNRTLSHKPTRLVVVNHCSNVTGAVQDIRTIAHMAHHNGALLVVDGSQSAGLHPVNVTADGVDVFVFAGHKYLYGLPGTGGFWLRGGLPLRPLKVGGTGVRSDLMTQPPQRPTLYESGTPNMIGLAALNEGVRYVLEQGTDRLRQQVQARVRQLHDGLAPLDGLTCYTAPLNGKTSMMTFTLDDNSPEETAYLLEQSFGIVTRAGLHCAPLIHRCLGCEPAGCVRLSPSVFTTEQEIDTVIEAVRHIARMPAGVR